jgi:hypothetical protein
MWVFSPINIAMNNCYFCTLDDLNDILKIHQSRFYVHDVEKPPAYYARFPTMLRSILQGLKPDHKVLGYKHEGYDKLTAYAIVWLPQNMPWSAIKMAEVIKTNKDDIDFFMTAWLAFGDTVAQLGEAEDRLQYFVATTLKAHMGLARFSKAFKGSSHVMEKYNFLLFSIIGPDGKLKNPVEEMLLTNYLIPQVKDIAIIEMSMREQYRLEHFKDRIGFKNPDLSKFVVND